MIKIFNEEKIIKEIEKELRKFKIEIVSIERIDSLPSNASYLDWSFGEGAEYDYSFKIFYKKGQVELGVMYSEITTLVNLIVIRKRFFVENNNDITKMINLVDL